VYINEGIFNDQMRGLMVARGNYLSAKDKEEKKRYWFLEFRNCDERAFIRTIEQLKFSEDSGFPTFYDFRTLYNSLLPPAERLKGKQFCGLCHQGTVLYRAVHPRSKEVHDTSANCSICAGNRNNDVLNINPNNLIKDKVGVLRTSDAMEMDRVPQENKYPEFYKEILKNHRRTKWADKQGNKDKGEGTFKKIYFLGLAPEDDPSCEIKIVDPDGVIQTKHQRKELTRTNSRQITNPVPY